MLLAGVIARTWHGKGLPEVSVSFSCCRHLGPCRVTEARDGCPVQWVPNAVSRKFLHVPVLCSSQVLCCPCQHHSIPTARFPSSWTDLHSYAGLCDHPSTAPHAERQEGTLAQSVRARADMKTKSRPEVLGCRGIKEGCLGMGRRQDFVSPGDSQQGGNVGRFVF